MDIPMVSIKGKGVKVVLTIRPNDQVFMVNQGASEARWAQVQTTRKLWAMA